MAPSVGQNRIIFCQMQVMNNVNKFAVKLLRESTFLEVSSGSIQEVLPFGFSSF